MPKYIAASKIRGLGGKNYEPGDELPNNPAVRALAKRSGVVTEFADHKPKGGKADDKTGSDNPPEGDKKPEGEGGK